MNHNATAAPAPSSQPSSWLVLSGGLMLVILWMIWLMAGIYGYRTGMNDFPTADGSRIDILTEDSRTGSIDTVAAAPDEAWKEWAGRYLPIASVRHTWLRVTLVNPGATPLAGVLADSEYLTDRIELWSRNAEGQWQTSISGENVTGAEKPLWGRTAAFPIIVGAGESTIVYLRVSDFYDGVFWLRWWPRASDFHQAQVRDTLAEFIGYGWLAALIIYNFVLWARLRFPDMGYYFLYALAMAVFNFASNGGFALLGLTLSSPWKEGLTACSLAFSGIFLVQFARLFLGTSQVIPRMDRTLRWGLLLLGGLIFGATLMPWFVGPIWFDLIILGAAVTHLLLLIAALRTWRKGVKHARYFVAAFGLLFAGGMPAVCAWIGGDMKAWAAMALLSGSLLEMLMLSFAVADRFTQTQRQLIEETEQRRMIQETYSDELEIEVCERTDALAKAVADKDRMISVLGHDLRSPLTGLMRAADGTEGDFAKLVARTSRGLLTLIEDLVLWAQLHAGSRVMTHYAVESVTAPAISLHRTLADQKQINLTVQISPEKEVLTDLVLAQTLVRNLISNALKAADCSVALTVVPDEVAPGKIRFTIINDGATLPPEIAAGLQNQRDLTSISSGLGLKLCIDICRVLGTRLDVESLPAGGAKFSFLLPVRR